MSDTHFIESSSTDPVERAIARKVLRILNDRTLDRQQRESLVKKAQRELIQHRRQVQQRQALSRQVSKLHLPKGYRPQAVLVLDGQVQLGALNRGSGFVWLEAGQAPQGIAANQTPFGLQVKAAKQRVARDPIAERRRELAPRR